MLCPFGRMEQCWCRSWSQRRATGVCVTHHHSTRAGQTHTVAHLASPLHNLPDGVHSAQESRQDGAAARLCGACGAQVMVPRQAGALRGFFLPSLFFALCLGDHQLHQCFRRGESNQSPAQQTVHYNRRNWPFSLGFWFNTAAEIVRHGFEISLKFV